MFSFKRKIGNQAEALAQKYLQQQGLSLIEKNYLTQSGEIDLIMLDKNHDSLVFVEVRYRQNADFGSATESVTAIKQKKIISAALQYLQRHPEYQEFICRFDVIGLESDLKCPQINWIKDAFTI